MVGVRVLAGRAASKFGCGKTLVGYPGRMKLAAVTTTPETIPAY
jgi:hypothetical protein